MATGFFHEKQGVRSVSRLIFFIGSLWNMTMSTILILSSDVAPAAVLAFFSGVEGVLVGLKLGQKPMEGKA